MTGFTLYETLRIFVPGLLAVGISDAVLRVGFGPNPLLADGGVGSAVRVLENAGAALMLALFAGLLLYLIDLPAKTRLFTEGAPDPDRPFRIPSRTMKGHMARTQFDDPGKAFGLYLILSDRYLPDDLHRRIYLFGSLYKVYVDLRALLGLGLMVGIGGSLASRSSTSHPRFLGASVPYVGSVAILVALMAVGCVGVATYRKNIAQKHGNAADFWRRLPKESLEVLWVVLAVFITGGAAAYLIMRGLLWGGAILGAITLYFWLAVEIGPPRREVPDLTATILRRLGAERAEGEAQYSVFQRVAVDLAFIMPWILIDAVSLAGQQFSVERVIAWATFAVPCVAILSVRKHETRLLESYETQSLWLDLHAEELKALRRDGRLPDEWN